MGCCQGWVNEWIAQTGTAMKEFDMTHRLHDLCLIVNHDEGVRVGIELNRVFTQTGTLLAC